MSLLLQAVLLWQLAALAKSDAGKARPFIASLFLAFIAMALLSWRFFFVAPVATELVMAVLIGLAYVRARPNEGLES